MGCHYGQPGPLDRIPLLTSSRVVKEKVRKVEISGGRLDNKKTTTRNCCKKPATKLLENSKMSVVMKWQCSM